MLRSAPPPNDHQSHREQLDRAWSDAWSFLDDVFVLADDERAAPVTLRPGSLDEPIVLTRPGDGSLLALSNVCTHRGAVICSRASTHESIRCPYHGRRFDLRGRVLSSPGFALAEGFPADEDHLPTIPLERIGPLLFTNLAREPEPFEPMRELLDRHVGFFPFDALTPDATSTRDYTIEAHWTLWCDNYLEGLHIPYVHPALARTIDPSDYRIVLGERSSLQYAMAARDEPAFELPDGHPDAGLRVAGYYLFLFPGAALNFYPWGLSLNVVRPGGPRRTTVHYRVYVLDESLRERGAGAALDRVEQEDDAIIERAQRGASSRLYRGGRYAEGQERAVAHFQRWLREPR